MKPKKIVALAPENRVLAKDLKSGEEFLWLERQGDHSVLHRATAARCDDCNALGAVNSLKVQNDAMLEGTRGWCTREPEEVGAYDDDGSGDCLCDSCARARSNARKTPGV